MGFKTNFHPEVLVLLGTLFIMTVSMNNSANANIPSPESLTLNQEFPSIPLPQLNIPNVEELKKPKLPEVDNKELDCLAEAVYFESKNQSLRGQRAVAHVIVNRTKSYRFPETICKVVNQKYKSTCQFSYKCDGSTDVPRNKAEFEIAVSIAKDVLDGAKDITKGALYFHNNTVKPTWAKVSKLTMVIGNHKFYRG